MSKSLSIAWFRQDLRIHDNPALNAAAEQGALLPIYILDDVNAAQWAMGGASRAWLHHSLTALNDSLDGRLLVFAGDARTIIRRLVEEQNVAAVFWNRCYEPWRIQRDSLIKQDLQEAGVDSRSFNASLLWEPWEVAKKDGTSLPRFYAVLPERLPPGAGTATTTGTPGAAPIPRYRNRVLHNHCNRWRCYRRSMAGMKTFAVTGKSVSTTPVCNWSNFVRSVSRL